MRRVSVQEESEVENEGSCISKLDVVQSYVITSVEMIACEMNPLSTHIVVMTCEEIIDSLAHLRGVRLMLNYRVFVKDDHHKYWRKKTRQSYNYFKHADRDPQAPYSGPSMDSLRELNDITTLANANGLHELGGKYPDVAKSFTALMVLLYPSLFKLDYIFKTAPLARPTFEELQGASRASIMLALRQELRRLSCLPDP
jgi:hypothetical protein